MRIPRIHIPGPIESGKDVFLTGSPLQHVAKVLRLRAGAEITLFDGRGGEWRAILDTIRPDHAQLRLVEHVTVDRESPLRWELVQGISRGERMDYTLQKAVELGVAEVHPVITRRTVVRLNAEKAARRRDHWQGVVTSAAQQSGRTALPCVNEVRGLDEFLGGHENGLILVLDPEAHAGVGQLVADRPERVFIVAGPEGGFDENERALLYRNGAAGVNLGPRILRTETAALVAAALILSRWGDY